MTVTQIGTFTLPGRLPTALFAGRARLVDHVAVIRYAQDGLWSALNYVQAQIGCATRPISTNLNRVARLGGKKNTSVGERHSDINKLWRSRYFKRKERLYLTTHGVDPTSPTFSLVNEL